MLGVDWGQQITNHSGFQIVEKINFLAATDTKNILLFNW